MDPSIVKLLEEDEDESMHSGADVDALQAALNRDIEGHASTSQPSDTNAVLPGGNNHTCSQFAQWQTASQNENAISQSQQSSESMQQQEQHPSQHEQPQSGSVSENQQGQNDSQDPNRLLLQPNQSQDAHKQGLAVQIAPKVPQTTGGHVSEKNPIPLREPERSHNQDSESQYLKLQKMSNQQATSTEHTSNTMNRGSKQVPFAVLLPALLPQLDKDRAMQLHTLYAKLKKNEIAKDGFVRHMRDIVGDQMLRLAVNKLQLQMGSNQFQVQSQAPGRQNHPRVPSVSAAATQFTDPTSIVQLHQKTSNSPSDTSHTSSLAAKMKPDSAYPTMENSSQKSREVERQSDSRGVLVGQISSSSSSPVIQERERSSTSVQGLNKQPQQHIQFPQTSFPMYGSGSGSYHPYSGTNVSTSVSSLKPQPHDPQVRQITHSQSVGSTPYGGASQAMNMMSVPKFERQNSMNDSNRVQGGSLSHFQNKNSSALQQNSVPWQTSASKEQSSAPLSSMTYVKPEVVDQGADQQHKSNLSTPQSVPAVQVEHGNAIPGALKDDLSEKQSSRMSFSTSTGMMPSNSVSSSMTSQLDSSVPLSSRIPSVTSPSGVNARTPPKKPSVGQKKPLETLGSSPPPSSKKQKVSGAFLDQSIEQLNDVTAVSGVNLREEEEQLFSGSKEDSRVSEASRRVVQEEEERLLLQKTPLQKKLAEILAKCGLKNISNDVERCLSLCVEERMRALLCNIIRLSKQRIDAEKDRHRTFITSDVRQQIMIINRKAREEWDKKQAEAEKLRKLNEPESDSGVDGDKEKDEGRVKLAKPNKEEDDKMRTTAANVAARAAVGGDDMLSKWQLMAEQARQKREGGIDAASGSQTGKDVNRRSSATSGRNAKDNQEAEKRGHRAPGSASGNVRKFGRNQLGGAQPRVPRNVSVKDVIAVLEREPQMCKSTLIYRLYEKICSEAAAE